MKENIMEWVYDSTMGHLQEAYRCNQVENLFEEGKPCGNSHRAVFQSHKGCHPD